MNFSHLLPTDFAYLAGLIDGEGTIGIYLNSRGYYQLSLSITQVDEDLISWLQKTFGGSIHNESPERNNQRARYRWRIGADIIRELIPLVLPYLRLKKRHGEIAIQFLVGRKRGGNPGTTEYQEPLYDELHILNRRGVDHSRTAKAEFLGLIK